MKFRKKPVVVEAVQWFKHGDHPAVEKDLRHVVDSPFGLIKTLEDSYDGAHFVEPGDWIITGVKGEHYACKPDIFAMTYEPVDAPASGSDLERAARERIARMDDGPDGGDFLKMVDLINELRSAKTNGDALGALGSFRYNTRLNAIDEAIRQLRRGDV